MTSDLKDIANMDPILDDIYERAILLAFQGKALPNNWVVSNTDKRYSGWLQEVKPMKLNLTEKQVLDACKLLVKNGLLQEFGPKRSFTDRDYEQWLFRVLTPHEIAQRKSKP